MTRPCVLRECVEIPPCDDCNDPSYNGCGSGKRCEGGCCVNYTCPSGQPKCDWPAGTCISNGGECVSGCCQPIPCNDNGGCQYGYHCSGGECTHSVCPGTGYGKYSSNECYGNAACNQATGCCEPPESPILIDVEGDGFLLTEAAEGVTFDIRADGKPVKLAWTAPGSDDAWLSLDRNGNGQIDNARELFGNHTPQAKSEGERNGFEALAVFDRPALGGTADGRITEADAVFSRLHLWQDRNHNGRSESDELLPLSALGVTGISLDYKESRWVDIHGNQFRYRSRVDRDERGRGSYKWALDVFLVLAGGAN